MCKTHVHPALCLQEVADVLHLLERHPRFVDPLHAARGYAVDELA